MNKNLIAVIGGIFCICAALALAGVLTKAILESDLPLWLKVMLLK